MFHVRMDDGRWTILHFIRVNPLDLRHPRAIHLVYKRFGHYFPQVLHLDRGILLESLLTQWAGGDDRIGILREKGFEGKKGHFIPAGTADASAAQAAATAHRFSPFIA